MKREIFLSFLFFPFGKNGVRTTHSFLSRVSLPPPPPPRARAHEKKRRATTSFVVVVVVVVVIKVVVKVVVKGGTYVKVGGCGTS